IGFYYFFLRNTDKAIVWKTAAIEKGSVRIIVTATGSINALTTVQVGTQVSGTISKLFADFNSVVKKGKLIALLDTTFLSASKEDAEAAVQKASLQVIQSKREFERVKILFDKNVISQSEYDLALTSYETAESILKSAKSQFTRSKINLQYAFVRAPISGTIISRNMDVGQTVISSFNSPVLFTIANDLTKMQVNANVDEADIGQIKIDQKAFFTVDAYPNESFNGVIKQIRLQPTVIQNVVNYTVIIDVPNPELKLMPGLTANINIIVNEHDNIFRVSSNAIRFQPPIEYFDKSAVLSDSAKNFWKIKLIHNNVVNKFSNIKQDSTHYIWIKKGDAIYPEKVVVGLSDDSYVEISGNINQGMEVVTGINKEEVTGSSVKNPFMPSMKRSAPKK
ncbi:MAG: efflux RND transporter periplasmic adaptor subunit, partial [Bacteroidetes bacterium]|nr:efflux RND transporter periplasmic adaptor subunit [Bacteroidota bacterium]